MEGNRMCDQLQGMGVGGAITWASMCQVPGELSCNFRVTIGQQGRFGGFLKATDYTLALTSDSRAKRRAVVTTNIL